MDKSEIAVWTDPDQFGLSLLALGLDRFGTEALTWTPYTWGLEILEDGSTINPRNLDRLMGAVTVLTKPDEFYKSPAGFCDLSNALGGQWFSPYVAHPPTTAEIAWAIIEAHLIDPPDPADGGFSPDVNKLVNLIAREEGFDRLPGVFKIFGITPAAGVNWGGLDIGDDPDMSSLAAASAGDAEIDLADDLADRLKSLSEKLSALPLTKSDPKEISIELLKFVSALSASSE